MNAVKNVLPQAQAAIVLHIGLGLWLGCAGSASMCPHAHCDLIAYLYTYVLRSRQMLRIRCYPLSTALADAEAAHIAAVPEHIQSPAACQPTALKLLRFSAKTKTAAAAPDRVTIAVWRPHHSVPISFLVRELTRPLLVLIRPRQQQQSGTDADVV